MAIDLDAFTLLRAIGAHPERFAPIGAEAQRLALRLLVRHARRYGSDPTGWRDLHATLGQGGLALFLDTLPEPDLRILARHVDRHNGAIGGWPPERIRCHLAEIAAGASPQPDPRVRKGAVDPVASIFSPAFAAVWTDNKGNADRD